MAITKPVNSEDALLAQYDKLIIYTDGAVRNYGKDNASSGVGIYLEGVALVAMAGNEIDVMDQTPTMMEFQAVFTALKLAQVHLNNLLGSKTKDDLPGFKAMLRTEFKIIIRTDSQFVIDSLCKYANIWSRRHWINHQGQKIVFKQVILDCFDKVSELLEYLNHENIQFEHVKAHTGIHGNEIADFLAGSGCDLMEGKIKDLEKY